MNRYLKDSSLTFGARIIILFVSVVTNIIIARVLGPSGKGILTIVSLFPFFIALLAGLGIDEANIYLLGSKKATHDKIFSNSIYLGIFMSVIFVALLLLFKTQILSGFLKNLNVQYFYLSVISIPFFLLWNYMKTILRGHSDFLKFNLLELGQSLLYLILLCIFVLIFKMGIMGGVLTFPLKMVGIFFVSLVVLWKIGKPFYKPDFGVLHKSLAYGLKAQPGVMLSFFNKRLDMFIVNFFLTPAQVGYYAISVVIAELLWHFPSAFAITLFTKTAGMEKNDANKFTSKIIRNITFIMLVAGCLLAILAKPLIYVTFGLRFYPSLIPLWFLLPGVLALGITKLICANFHGRGKPQYGTYLTIISVIFTIILDIVLIPRFGITGAAIASSIAYSVATILAISWFKRESGMPLREMFFIKSTEIKESLLLVREFINNFRNKSKEIPTNY